MALDFLRLGDCTFYGPALPEPYVRFELEKALTKHELLPDVDGLAGQTLRDQWDILRRKLRDVSPNSGPVAIANRLLDPLVSRLGYAKLTPADSVLTREGDEAGGTLMTGEAGAILRCWAIDYDADLDAPTQRGHAYRFSPVRIAQRVLLAAGERVGLITNGVELRLLLCDPARPDSHIEIDLNVWRRSRDLPDGYQLLLALACPKGVAALPEIVEDARLKQNKVTKELRVQARRAVEEFVQSVLDHPDNTEALAGHADKPALAKALWHEGLIVVYRLLFVLKCESTSDPSRVFRFASSTLWRNTYSPSTALARTVRRVLDEGTPSGRYLEDGLRVLFRLLAEGLDHPGLTVRPLGGALFGPASTPLLSSLRWGELAVAHLLNRLLWSDTKRGRERVHYGPLDVEDLGRVYEALLELEPGIATEPMCRLRRQKLEVVVPAAQGDKYKVADAPPDVAQDDEEDDPDEAEEVEDAPARGKKTKVEWIEKIPPGRFYLRVGLGRKSTGSFYTPHSFVRFLVQETLGPQCDERSPRDNPNPGAILKLKVLDPACGSGHFLVEACRFLAGRVYEASRLCDELATKAEHDAEAEKNAARKQAVLDRAAELRQRLKDLPDQEDELLSYLPSRSAGAEKAVLSAYDIARAEGICRRLVAVHCLYGADLNPLAVELAKLSLWIESHAEGFPLTFLDHRIVLGNSLTGPFLDKLILAPGAQTPVGDLFRQNLDIKLAAKLTETLSLVKELEASVGTDVRDIAHKAELKRELDVRLLPFRILAAAWSGGVMLGTDQPDGSPRCDDDAYADLLKQVGTTGDLPETIDSPDLRAMIAKGLGVAANDGQPLDPRSVPADARPALPFDLTFPEVFHPTGQPHGRHGFDAVIGNPPWDTYRAKAKEYFSTRSLVYLACNTGDQRKSVAAEILRSPTEADAFRAYQGVFDAHLKVLSQLFVHQTAEVDGNRVGGDPDLASFFAERFVALAAQEVGCIGVVLPSAVHASGGWTSIRTLLLKAGWRWCLSFENSRRLFEIPPVMKFALVVAGGSSRAGTIGSAFYLDEAEWLFRPTKDDRLVQYNEQILRTATGSYLAFPEARSHRDMDVLMWILERNTWTGEFLATQKIGLGREFHTNDDGWRMEAVPTELAGDPRRWASIRWLLDRSLLCCYEGKSIAQYDPFWTIGRATRWGNRQTKALQLAKCGDKRDLLRSAAFFRFMIRATSGSVLTNDRSTLVCCTLPGCASSHTVTAERTPWLRPNSISLLCIAVLNSFSFDFQVRLRVQAALSAFILEKMSWPHIESVVSAVLAHGALRLSAADEGFDALWRDQLGDAWREPGKPASVWPVLAGNDERWAVRAAIDAVVADAYGLSREQYAHVLSTFSHKSYPKAPDLCLAVFDELKTIGLEAFCQKHDPYHDIPLVETLPKPVIDLPIPDGSGDGGQGSGENTSAGRGRRKSGKRWQLQAGAPGTPGLFDPPPPKPAAAEPDPGKTQAVKTLLELRKVLTSAEVQEQFGFDPVAARAILKQLVEQDVAVVEGKAKGTKYRLKR